MLTALQPLAGGAKPRTQSRSRRSKSVVRKSHAASTSSTRKSKTDGVEIESEIGGGAQEPEAGGVAAPAAKHRAQHGELCILVSSKPGDLQDDEHNFVLKLKQDARNTFEYEEEAFPTEHAAMGLVAPKGNFDFEGNAKKPAVPVHGAEYIEHVMPKSLWYAAYLHSTFSCGAAVGAASISSAKDLQSKAPSEKQWEAAAKSFQNPEKQSVGPPRGSVWLIAERIEAAAATKMGLQNKSSFVCRGFLVGKHFPFDRDFRDKISKTDRGGPTDVIELVCAQGGAGFGKALIDAFLWYCKTRFPTGYVALTAVQQAMFKYPAYGFKFAATCDPEFVADIHPAEIAKGKEAMARFAKSLKDKDEEAFIKESAATLKEVVKKGAASILYKEQGDESDKILQKLCDPKTKGKQRTKAVEDYKSLFEERDFPMLFDSKTQDAAIAAQCISRGGGVEMRKCNDAKEVSQANPKHIQTPAPKSTNKRSNIKS